MGTARVFLLCLNLCYLLPGSVHKSNEATPPKTLLVSTVIPPSGLINPPLSFVPGSHLACTGNVVSLCSSALIMAVITWLHPNQPAYDWSGLRRLHANPSPESSRSKDAPSSIQVCCLALPSLLPGRLLAGRKGSAARQCRSMGTHAHTYRGSWASHCPRFQLSALLLSCATLLSPCRHQRRTRSP